MNGPGAERGVALNLDNTVVESGSARVGVVAHQLERVVRVENDCAVRTGAVGNPLVEDHRMPTAAVDDDRVPGAGRINPDWIRSIDVKGDVSAGGCDFRPAAQGHRIKLDRLSIRAVVDDF